MTKSSLESIRGKFGLICADPPWRFEDQLTMSAVRRGSSSQYGTLSLDALKALPVAECSAPDSLLALWVPSALIEHGLDVLRAWGFKHKQIFTWVKTASHTHSANGKNGVITEYKGNGLGFGMGHYFRACTEHALIGTRGSPSVVSKSERNVELNISIKHSSKPDTLQERLERMFPDVHRLEMFARRDRPGWVCVGNECPSTYQQDIRDWMKERLALAA